MNFASSSQIKFEKLVNPEKKYAGFYRHSKKSIVMQMALSEEESDFDAILIVHVVVVSDVGGT